MAAGDTDPDSPFVTTSLEEFHSSMVRIFVASPDFGNGRTGTVSSLLVQREVIAGSNTIGPAHELQAAYQATQFNLVSLLKHTPPVVYVQRPPLATDKHNAAGPAASRAADFSRYDKTRDLDGFELTALARLKGGETLVVEPAENGRVRMLGALRAEASCINCHEEAVVGSLLGAFSYVLMSMPVKTAEKP